MAASLSSSSAAASLLLFAALLSLLSSPVAARPGLPFHPCNTLFITYTVSTTTTTASLEASEDGGAVVPRRTSAFISVYRIVAPFRPSYDNPDAEGERHPVLMMIRRPEALPLRHDLIAPGEPALGFSSLRERAKDILVVVVGLLFGVGCGALTAATMYLVWLVVSSRGEICAADDYEEEDDLEDLKKAGYEKIPADEPAKVKEGYEGN